MGSLQIGSQREFNNFEVLLQHGSYKNGIKMQKILRENQSRHQFLQGILAPEKPKKLFFSGIFWKNHQFCVFGTEQHW